MPAALRRSRWPWGAPLCFAYSTADRQYACLDFAVQADSHDPLRDEGFDWSRWIFEPKARPGSWGMHRAILLVATDASRDPERISLVDKPYDRSREVEMHAEEPEVLAQLRRRGITSAVRSSGRLARDGTWRSLAGVELRFESWFREGVSAAYHARLELRCTPNDEPIALLEGVDMRGFAAWAFATPAAPGLVVAIVEIGGGEGSGYFRTRHVAVPIERHCGHRVITSGHRVTLPASPRPLRPPSWLELLRGVERD